MAKIEDALRAEVSRVCRNYYLQVWNEALNQTRVEASSVLRKAKSVYYPPAIRASSSSSSKANTPPEVANPKKSSPNEVPPSSGSPPKVIEQPRVNGKDVEVIKGVSPNATKPWLLPKILPKTRRHPRWRLSFPVFQYLPKVTLKAQIRDPQRLQFPSPRPRPKEKL